MMERLRNSRSKCQDMLSLNKFNDWEGINLAYTTSLGCVMLITSTWSVQNHEFEKYSYQQATVTSIISQDTRGAPAHHVTRYLKNI